MSRRGFLKTSALITSGSLLIPQFLKAMEAENVSDSEKILIIIQLSGGNDGLNTIIPYRNDVYYRMRPSIGITKEQALKGTDELGFNPAMSKFKELYDQGFVTVINNVGYPNPDRSHFRSMDIWQTASQSDEYLSTGWIGRYLDSNCEGCGSHTAVEIDDSLSLALRGERVKGMAIKDPAKLYQATQSSFYKKVSENHADEPNVEYLYKTMAETVSNAAYIYDKSKISRSGLEYPNNEFAKRLKTIAELIQSGIKTKVYYASLTGFDTHVRQTAQQERLLTTYSEAVNTFVKDLKATGNFDRSVIMTFSEFGRRVEENASGGTDHGTANNLFLMGGKLKTPGFFNKTPDLLRLDQGDLMYEVDFRQVYATMLKNWLGTDSKIIGTGFPSLALV
ncbi:MAG: DUF1501 domain-containing protein [Cyclobacteriaceae bacterium]|nr:DUF1501 domain-containing protein [Cyclobacteriaceae bacterium]